MTDTWDLPSAPQARADREYAALSRIDERYAGTGLRRDRWRNPSMIGPDEAVRLVVALASGAATTDADETAIEATDLMAALTLMPTLRAEIDQLESALLTIGRARGATWRQLAFGLGLESAQAARQRYERLGLRVHDNETPL